MSRPTNSSQQTFDTARELSGPSYKPATRPLYGDFQSAYGSIAARFGVPETLQQTPDADQFSPYATAASRDCGNFKKSESGDLSKAIPSPLSFHKATPGSLEKTVSTAHWRPFSGFFGKKLSSNVAEQNHSGERDGTMIPLSTVRGRNGQQSDAGSETSSVARLQLGATFEQDLPTFEREDESTSKVHSSTHNYKESVCSSRLEGIDEAFPSTWAGSKFIRTSRHYLGPIHEYSAEVGRQFATFTDVTASSESGDGSFNAHAFDRRSRTSTGRLGSDSTLEGIYEAYPAEDTTIGSYYYGKNGPAELNGSSFNDFDFALEAASEHTNTSSGTAIVRNFHTQPRLPPDIPLPQQPNSLFTRQIYSVSAGSRSYGSHTDTRKLLHLSHSSSAASAQGKSSPSVERGRSLLVAAEHHPDHVYDRMFVASDSNVEEANSLKHDTSSERHATGRFDTTKDLSTIPKMWTGSSPGRKPTLVTQDPEDDRRSSYADVSDGESQEDWETDAEGSRLSTVIEWNNDSFANTSRGGLQSLSDVRVWPSSGLLDGAVLARPLPGHLHDNQSRSAPLPVLEHPFGSSPPLLSVSSSPNERAETKHAPTLPGPQPMWHCQGCSRILNSAWEFKGVGPCRCGHTEEDWSRFLYPPTRHRRHYEGLISQPPAERLTEVVYSRSSTSFFEDVPHNANPSASDPVHASTHVVASHSANRSSPSSSFALPPKALASVSPEAPAVLPYGGSKSHASRSSKSLADNSKKLAELDAFKYSETPGSVRYPRRLRLARCAPAECTSSSERLVRPATWTPRKAVGAQKDLLQLSLHPRPRDQDVLVNISNATTDTAAAGPRPVSWFARHAQRWTMRPDPAHLRIQRENFYQPGAYNRLPAARESRDMATVRRKEQLSWVVFAGCCIVPPVLLLYGHGLLDSLMLSLSHGEIGSFGQSQKKAARYAGCVLTLAVILTIVAAIVRDSSA
ncbi:hypothetical protein LTR04_006469 [Oleoguttula sp. CCFEE 6159]|nr:hypothetical protein LTR04_006469 [Oleoguttula sp. CCFEE 6159]